MAAQDPHYSSVGLLLPFEGATGSVRSFSDFAPSPKALIVGGNTQISATSKWGNGAVYLDGSGDYLRVPYVSTLSISGDFTLEVWVNASSSPPDNIGAIVSQDYGSGTTPFLFALINGSGTWLAYYYSAGASEWSVVNGLLCGSGLAFGTWYHFAICRAGQVYRGFRDGVLINSVTAANNPGSKTVEWIIGTARDRIGTPFKGYLQDLRFTQYARYTANFTPPGRLVIPQYPDYGSPLTAIGNNLTIAGNGAGDSVAIIDATTKTLVKVVDPATNGDWTASIPAGDYYVLYFGDGCQPIAHGPYTVSA